MSENAFSNPELPKRALSWLTWTGITALGAFALAGIALNRNEPVSAAWLVTAAICVYLILSLLQQVHRREGLAAGRRAHDAGRAP
jgi:surface polysaccharide O-acyltransferase-like enzyme